MNTIRIRRLLMYFMKSLDDIVRSCEEIQKSYVFGKISYRRTRKQLDVTMKLAWDRLQLCSSLLELLDVFTRPANAEKSLNEYGRKLCHITDWTNS